MPAKLLPFLLLLALTGWHTADPAYQKIILDDHYNNIQPKDVDPKSILHYKVKAAKGIILDCSKYDFAAIRKMNDDKDPDRIHIICKSGSFEVDLNMTGETVIDPTTTFSMGDHKKFAGFQKADNIIMGIGTLKVSSDTAQMLTYWVALMDVE